MCRWIILHALGNNSNHPLGSNSKGPHTKFFLHFQGPIFPLLIFPLPEKTRLISMLRIHTACSAQKTHPSCNPCLVHTFWHIASLNLKEL